jgi:hypothetical protein
MRSTSTQPYTSNRDTFKMKSYLDIEPKLARTIDNENAPNKVAGYNPQPDYMGAKKFYGGLKKTRKSSATRRTSLSNTGVNEQHYSPMTKFKHDLEGNKI